MDELLTGAPVRALSGRWKELWGMTGSRKRKMTDNNSLSFSSSSSSPPSPLPLFANTGKPRNDYELTNKLEELEKLYPKYVSDPEYLSVKEMNPKTKYDKMMNLILLNLNKLCYGRFFKLPNGPKPGIQDGMFLYKLLRSRESGFRYREVKRRKSRNSPYLERVLVPEYDYILCLFQCGGPGSHCSCNNNDSKRVIHPQICGDVDNEHTGMVVMAGECHMKRARNGVFISFNTDSGHFKPSVKRQNKSTYQEIFRKILKESYPQEIFFLSFVTNDDWGAKNKKTKKKKPRKRNHSKKKIKHSRKKKYSKRR